MKNLSEIRVLIAEDEALVRQGIAALIQPHVSEIIEAGDGEQALRLLKTQVFDIALIDIGLPGRTGLDVLAEIRARQIPVKTIILTGDTSTHSPARIYEAGANGFLYKTTDAAQFLQTFLDIIKGKSPTQTESPQTQTRLSIAQLRETLTSRETQIVKLIVEGENNKSIAQKLFISEHTVRKHREHINKKLDVRSPASLARFAIKAGLV